AGRREPAASAVQLPQGHLARRRAGELSPPGRRHRRGAVTRSRPSDETAPDERPRKGQGLEWAMAVWRRRRWLPLPAFGLRLGTAVALIVSMPSVFESRAVVLVDRQQVPEEFVRSTVTSALEVRLRTISEEILSRSRLDALITRFGLYPKLRDTVSRE